MAILVHRYDEPDRFVAGTVGQPGERAFFLQAREGNRITSVACEKQQVSVLAEHLDRVLDEVVRRSTGPAAVPPSSAKARDTDPLDAPITEEFRVGTMTIAWDPSIDRIVIELFSNVDVEEPEDEAAEVAPEPATPRRTTSSRTRSRCSASTETCCFSQATLVMRLPSRAWRKKVRSPGWPTVPATKRSGAS